MITFFEDILNITITNINNELNTTFSINDINCIDLYSILDTNKKANFEHENLKININVSLYSEALIEFFSHIKNCNTEEEINSKLIDIITSPTPYMFQLTYVLAHELRHYFQYKNNKSLYLKSFVNYTDLNNEKECKKYNENHLEIDAAAYSIYYMNNFTNYDLNDLIQIILNDNYDRKKVMDLVRKFSENDFKF